MSFYDVYIGSLDGYPWEGGNWNGNCPVPLSPLFPPVRGRGLPLFFTVKERIQQGIYDGKQIDFAGFVARVTRSEIEQLISESYQNDDWYGSDSIMPHLNKQLTELKEYIRELSTAEKYALVAREV